MATTSTIRASPVAAYDAALVDELLAAYEEAKQNYYLGGLRLSAVEGGRSKRFAHQVGDHYTITRTGQLDVEKRKLIDPPP